MSQDNVILLAQSGEICDATDRRGVEIWTKSLGDEPGRRVAEIGVEIFNLSRQRLICHIGNVTIRVVLVNGDDTRV